MHQKSAGQKSPPQTQKHQSKAKYILSCPSVLLAKKELSQQHRNQYLIHGQPQVPAWSPFKNLENGHLRHLKYWITGSTKESRKEVSVIWRQAY